MKGLNWIPDVFTKYRKELGIWELEGKGKTPHNCSTFVSTGRYFSNGTQGSF